jgi:hypothetical protein
MREQLVRLADKFDREGKTDLADAIDRMLSTASRQKAPLKNLDEDVKKDLLKFVHRVKKNIEDSAEALEEFFRRLRYFDVGDSVKELKLDKVLKDLEKTQECMDSAGKTMYALTYGKHPSKSDMEQLADDFETSDGKKMSPLEFFESQSGKSRNLDELEERDEEGLREMERGMYGDEEGDVSEEELEVFWQPEPDLEDDEDDESDEQGYEDLGSFEDEED